jgi:hypothetical protein
VKKENYQRRFYRDWTQDNDLYKLRLAVQETDLQILTDLPVKRELLQEKILHYRRQIENYISRDPRFLVALKPLNVELNAPGIIQAMAQAAKVAGVGPMAAVAGAIAEYLGRGLLKEGLEEVIIENGGDIFLKIKKTRRVAIYSGIPKAWKRLTLKIKPAATPLGICTSSGTLGHSLSFGSADAVTILAKDAILADAVATATANRVISKKDFQPAIAFARKIKGVRGILIVLKNKLVSWGDIELI